MEDRRIYPYLVVFLLAVMTFCVVKYALDDRTPPVITFHENQMLDEYSDDMDPSELLVGVSAYDEVDGNVSYSLEILNLVVLSSGEEIQVTYVARDSKNNLEKQSIKFPYVGTKSFIDIDVDEVKETTEQETTTQEETTEPPTELPTDELGGSGEPVKIDKEQADATGIPQIELKYTHYTIKKGETFGSGEGLEMVADTYDDKDTVSNRIVISNLAKVDTSVAGDYVITYSVSDKEGNRSEGRDLTVHVIE